MTGTAVDRIVSDFAEYCKTGIVPLLTSEDFGWLQHATGKALRREGNLAGHPLFILMALTGDPTKVIAFVEAANDLYIRSVR